MTAVTYSFYTPYPLPYDVEIANAILDQDVNIRLSEAFEKASIWEEAVVIVMNNKRPPRKDKKISCQLCIKTWQEIVVAAVGFEPTTLRV